MQQKRVVRASSVQRDPVAVAMEKAGFDRAGWRAGKAPVRSESRDYRLEDRLRNWGMVRGMAGRELLRWNKPADMPFWVQRYYQYQQSKERQLAIAQGLYVPLPYLARIEADIDREAVLRDAEEVEAAWRSLRMPMQKELLKLYYVTGFCVTKISERLGIRERQFKFLMADAKRELKNRLECK